VGVDLLHLKISGDGGAPTHSLTPAIVTLNRDLCSEDVLKLQVEFVFTHFFVCFKGIQGILEGKISSVRFQMNRE
jgi:hypothetical protein